jgi:hypothetical protein
MNKIAFIYFSYNRKDILARSLETSLKNTNIKPNKIYIFDDCSDAETQNMLKDFTLKNKYDFTIQFNEKNIGYAGSYKKCFDILKNNEFDYVFFLETDYIWRKGYLEEALEILEAEEDSVAICGSSFKEFYDKSKCHKWFGEVMVNQFDKDVSNRNYLYNPKYIKTKNYNINIQYGTHCCGTFLFNKKRFFNNLDQKQKIKFWEIMEKASEVQNNKSVINDGMITGGISLLWDEFLQKKYNGKKFDKSAFIDIIDYVIGVHVEGGGINGSDNPEGYTRYFPPNFPINYNEFYRNKE